MTESADAAAGERSSGEAAEEAGGRSTVPGGGDSATGAAPRTGAQPASGAAADTEAADDNVGSDSLAGGREAAAAQGGGAADQAGGAGEPVGAPGSDADPDSTAPDADGSTGDGADEKTPADGSEDAAGATALAGGRRGGSGKDRPGGRRGTAGPRGGARPRSWLRWVAGGAGLAVLATAGVGWWFYQKLDGNITTDTSTAAELQTYDKDRPTPVALDALNVLLIGSDTRSGKGNGKYGRNDGGVSRSDTTILLHLAADRKSATAVSIPRDLMVHIPGCSTSDGSKTSARFAQFNWAYEFGGTACTTRTVEQLTGVRVDHEMVIDFSGFKDMVNAVHGVEICLAERVDDQDAHLHLPAGRQTLNGEQALGFVRARHGFGDGSDTERIERQQGFLGALFKKLQSNGVLLNPTRLYPVLDAATKSITTDPGLDSLPDLYDLVHSMQSVPTDKVQFLTVPRQPYAPDPNRDELVQPDAGKLFEELRDDTPVAVRPSSVPGVPPSGTPGFSGKGSGKTGGTADAGTGAEPSDSGKIPQTPGGTPATPSPTFPGTNASVGLCA